MKNKLLLNAIRKIKNNYKRFLSLLFMSLLGVGFYSGIKATSPAMLKTLDNFYDQQNVYDIEITSALGLTNDDLNYLKDNKNIKKIYGSKNKDAYLNIKNETFIIKAIELNKNINTPILLNGHFPKETNEIVVEERLLKENNLKINSTISIDNKLYKIVGTVISPLYFSDTTRGTTSLGDGQLDYYLYVKEKSLDNSYYNSIYLTVDNAKKEVTSTKEYKKLIKQVEQEIKKVKLTREKERFKELSQYYLLTNNKIPLTEKEASWYVFNREKIPAYKDLVDASENMKKLANVFPLVFFVIAVLISLISMMRMVEEDRSENGTLKALGFSNKSICLNYFLYSFLATLIGGILGFSIGIIFLPTVIWNIYSMMFTIPDFILSFDLTSGLIGLIVSVFCICGTALFVAIKNLKNVPAVLMRPKSPKKGQKIILEYIPFVWKKIKFSNKVVIRNIFRYKSRVAATIIGIAGCTALILAGFGLRDSIRDIVNFQFNDIFVYDEIITINNPTDNFIQEIKNNNLIEDVVESNQVTATIKNKKTSREIILVVPNDSSKLNSVIKLQNPKTKKKLTLKDNEIIISEKIARLLEIKKGDYITLATKNNKNKKIKVGAITENYLNLYAYINKNTKNELFENYNTNTLYLNFNSEKEKKINEFNTELSTHKNILSIIKTNTIMDAVLEVMNSLNSVVIILIVAAAILAFVVLYNLSNINICERKREIATLKVLGFYNNEVDAYITKENIFLTMIGIPLGLFFGFYLTYFIISTCETDAYMFVRHIKFSSYVYASLITIIFTIIVNMITHFNLKKIDMIESLKNVE